MTVCHKCQRPLHRDDADVWRWRGEPVCRSCGAALLGLGCEVTDA